MSVRILVVDDEEDVVETVAGRLLREGYIVAKAYDGEAALDLVKEFNPDIILLDLMMPKINGLDVVKEVRTKHLDKWMPIIIISAKTELETIKKCYEFEADHYLTKPCSLEAILQAVATMVSLIPLRINKA